MPTEPRVTRGPGTAQIAPSLGLPNRGSTTISTTTGRPSLMLTQSGVGSVRRTASMREEFITDVSTELNTPDIKLEDISAQNAFQVSRDSRKLVPIEPNQGRGMEAAGGVAAPLPLQDLRAHSPTNYLDMSPLTQDQLSQDGFMESDINSICSDIPKSVLDDLSNILNDDFLNDFDEGLNGNEAHGPLLSQAAIGNSSQNFLIPLTDHTEMQVPHSPTMFTLREEDEIPSQFQELIDVMQDSDAPVESLDPMMEIDLQLGTDSGSLLPTTTEGNGQDLMHMVLRDCGIFEEEMLEEPMVTSQPGLPSSTHPPLFAVPTPNHPSFFTTPLAPTTHSAPAHTSLNTTPLAPTTYSTPAHTSLSTIPLAPTTHPAPTHISLLTTTPTTHTNPSHFSLITTTPAPVNHSASTYPSLFTIPPASIHSSPSTTIPVLTLSAPIKSVSPAPPTAAVARPTFAKTKVNATSPLAAQSAKSKSQNGLSALGVGPAVHPYQSPGMSSESVSGLGPIRMGRQKRATRKPPRLNDDYLLDESLQPLTTISSDCLTSVPANSSGSNYSPDHSSSSLDDQYPPGVPSTSSGRRRNRHHICKELTDEEKYRRTRRLNNEASKRCRVKRKGKLAELKEEDDKLMVKNKKLKQEVAFLSKRRDRYRAMFDLFTRALQRPKCEPR